MIGKFSVPKISLLAVERKSESNRVYHSVHQKEIKTKGKGMEPLVKNVRETHDKNSFEKAATTLMVKKKRNSPAL